MTNIFLNYSVCLYNVKDVTCMLAVNGVWMDQLDWWDEYHPYIAFSPPLSLFPSVWVCWRVEDSQRFISVTLSKSDISLTTPRTGTHMRVQTQSLFHTHTHIVFFLSTLLFSSQNMSAMRSTTDKEWNNALNQYQQTWLRLLSLS